MMRITLPVAAITILFAVSSCTKDKHEPPSSTSCDSVFTTVTYDSHTKNIIDLNCAISGCHIPGGSGNGDFTNYAGVKIKVDNGSFRQRVLIKRDMPSNSTLLPCDFKALETWVNANAPQ